MEFLDYKFKKHFRNMTIWIKVFKNGPSKICRRQPLKNLKWYFKLFKGCLPQISLGTLLNTLSYMTMSLKSTMKFHNKITLSYFKGPTCLIPGVLSLTSLFNVQSITIFISCWSSIQAFCNCSLEERPGTETAPWPLF